MTPSQHAACVLLNRIISNSPNALDDEMGEALSMGDLRAIQSFMLPAPNDLTTRIIAVEEDIRQLREYILRPTISKSELFIDRLLDEKIDEARRLRSQITS